ncbi:Rha family transcriptional regulator [Halomonas sp. MMSF_3323]|uniref:Rha family transcriptional regulator n=1 Tax=Halomonas sp. MMSF_3323 TaxID=3046701 RepID=UPI0035319E4A
MSSREIAELTGKRHNDVMRDIPNMFDQLDADSAQFCAQYRDSTGRFLPCFARPLPYRSPRHWLRREA